MELYIIVLPYKTISHNRLVFKLNIVFNINSIIIKGYQAPYYATFRAIFNMCMLITTII